ncbi:iron-siderophore ABC transporter substrate-binding protein [Blastococcus sp. URHD0036]|uniref:ABC transporter substrate-binding protein n=1 Tax=Blastococcus sp. URHD0036 TaxID=1380356 RepID=UPI000495C053|nr:iron-siderophore ABC transporter substrate-binding protein [Blastococcus sp. URHD0036]
MSRRPFRTRLLIPLAVLSLVGACSAEDGDEPSAAGDGDGVFPVTVEHAFGGTTVPERPQRVVTVGYTEQDTVLALGVVPVGVTEWYGDQPSAVWPWAQDELGDAEPTVLSADDGINVEAVAALEPDLIIGTNAGLDEETYEALSGIAPTIAHSGEQDAYFEPWDVQAELIGTALGRREEALALIDEVKGQFADAAAAHPEFAGTTAVFLQNAVYDGSFIAYQDGLSTDFLTDLGFVVPSSIEQFAADGQAYIPLEQAGVLNDAEVLVWGTETPEDRPALEEQAVYRTLAAVQAGRLAFTDEVLAGAIYFTSPLSLPYVLDELVPRLEAAVAGDPATLPAAG